MTLKDGSTPADPRLGRIYQRDLRSLNHLLTARLPEDKWRWPRSYSWRLNHWLDQGYEGACVGYALAHELLARPVPVSGIDGRYARERIYWPAQQRDEWPGGAYPDASPFYEGTSVLAGMQTLHKMGYYTGYNWALSVHDVAIGLAYTGPCVLGLDWYTHMFDPDTGGFIHPTGRIEGGHCIVATGVKIRWKSWINYLVSKTWDNVDLDRSYITLHNSWSQAWGQEGRAKLTLTELQFLIDRQGEAVFPLRNIKIQKAI